MLTSRTHLDRTFSRFDALTRQMSSLQNLYFADPPRRGAVEVRRPAIGTEVTLTENETAFVLAADLPGLGEKDVELSVTHEELTIKATRKIEPPDGYRMLHHERADYALARSYALPSSIDPDEVEARMKDGVLTITLPKAPEAKPRAIEIVAG